VSAAPRVAVVGHVEWVDFLVVSHLPGPGEILHVASAHEAPAGGGGMAAYALTALTGSGAFWTVLGDDARAEGSARMLRDAGVEVRGGVREGAAQRRVITYLSGDGERTITVLGERFIPQGDDAGADWAGLSSYDAIYLTAGDAAVTRAARGAGLLAVTARARDSILAAGVPVDVLIGSATDPGERLDDELLAVARPGLIVQTEGAAGGSWRAADGSSGRWDATPLPGAPVDAYGCGDAFATALTAALARGDSIAGACTLAAHVGAALLCERAPAVGDLARYW
jgi:ribokinase